MTCDILLDVGGTGIKGSVVTNGEIHLPYAEFPAHASESRDVLAKHLSGIIRDLSGSTPVRQVAMAFPGPFDYDRGVPLMRGLSKYEALYGVCLPELLALPLAQAGIAPEHWRFINDVAAFALGVHSALNLEGRVMNICLGTGAGSAFVVHGRLIEKEGDGVPAHGWIYPIPYDGATIDDHFSDRGIRSLSQRMGLGQISPQELNLLAAEGNQIAREIWQVFGRRMAKVFEILLLNFRADILVLGGKIARAEKWFAAPLRVMCERHGIRLVILSDTTLYIMRDCAAMPKSITGGMRCDAGEAKGIHSAVYADCQRA